MDAVRTISEKMNSDMFDRVEKAVYNIESFSKLEVEQAKQSFYYNRYRTYINENELSIKKL